MRIEIVGLEKIDYFSKKSNKQVQGLNIHFIDKSHVPDRLTGYQVGTQYVNPQSPVYSMNLLVGSEYTMYKDGYSIEYFAPYTEYDE